LKRAAWTGIAISILIGLPLAGLILAAILIDPNQYKPRIIALVADQTGRTLSLNGPIRIAWSLRPTLSIIDARLANLPGGSRPDMARVERIEARVSLLALLRRRVQIDRLTLVGPNILLEQVGGQPNWVFQRQVAPRTAKSNGFQLAILTAHVQNGMVTFHFPARTSVVGLRSFDYDHAAWSEPLRVDAVLVYRDFKPFTLQALATPTDGVFDPWTTTIRTSAFDATISAKGTMSLDGPFVLAVSMHAPALEKLNQLLPALRLPALHDMDLSTHIRNGPRRGDLPILGESSLRFDSADLGDTIAGLSLSDVVIRLPKEGGVATATGDGRYSTQGFTLQSSIAVPVRLDTNSRSAVTMRVLTDAATPDTLALHGTLGLADGSFDGFDGAASLQAATLAAFRPLALPMLPDLTSLSLKTKLAVPASLGQVALHDLAISAREGDLEGKATLGLEGAHAVTGTLHSSRLDLDDLLPKPAHQSNTSIMSSMLPWESLRGPSLDLAWRADTVRYRQQDWADLRLSAKLDDGTLALTLPGGLLQGGASVEAGKTQAGRDQTVPIRLSLRTRSLPLAPLAGLAGLPGRTDGTLSLLVILAGHGDTLHEVAGTLDGTVMLSTTGASITDQALVSLAGPALKQLGNTLPANGRTTIRCFGVAGTVAGGVAKLSTIALDTGNLTISGIGTVDLGRETVMLKLHPLAHLAGSKVAVPVVVNGGFGDLHAALDASGLDKVGLLIDALFGGDHPKTCRKAGLLD